MIARLRNALRTLWQRICWNAWDYARRREIERRHWRGDEAAELQDDTPEQRRLVANEARQLLENKHFRQAFAAVDAEVEAQALACDPRDMQRAQNIVLAKQLLQKIRREVIRKMEDGWMAEVEIAEIERKKKITRFAR